MRKNIGSLCILSGVLLLLNPKGEMNDYLLWFEIAVKRYWPFLLILFGMSLQTKSVKRKRKSR